MILIIFDVLYFLETTSSVKLNSFSFIGSHWPFPPLQIYCSLQLKISVPFYFSNKEFLIPKNDHIYSNLKLPFLS